MYIFYHIEKNSNELNEKQEEKNVMKPIRTDSSSRIVPKLLLSSPNIERRKIMFINVENATNRAQLGRCLKGLSIDVLNIYDLGSYTIVHITYCSMLVDNPAIAIDVHHLMDSEH